MIYIYSIWIIIYYFIFYYNDYYCTISDNNCYKIITTKDDLQNRINTTNNCYNRSKPNYQTTS